VNTPRFVLAIVSTMSMTAALAQPADLQPRVQTSGPTSTSTSTPTPPVQPAAAKTTAPLSSPGRDSIELSTTQISGNRELPKLLYVVPWRRDALGNFVGRPPNSLVDEALTPVDRAVFQRQNRYYAALQTGSPSARSQPDTTGVPPVAAHPKDER